MATSLVFWFLPLTRGQAYTFILLRPDKPGISCYFLYSFSLMESSQVAIKSACLSPLVLPGACPDFNNISQFIDIYEASVLDTKPKTPEISQFGEKFQTSTR